MSDDRLPQNRWVIYAVSGVVLLLWLLWRALPAIRDLLSGNIRHV